MYKKASSAISDPVHPPVGTFIDGGSLKLVDVLGVGGYGVVYRAIDTRQGSCPKTYAVKCLVPSGHQTPRRRRIHIREIALHQLASAHPGVVTLHREVEESKLTYIVMDYAPDNLSTHILRDGRYLGDNPLIKDIFLQLLEVVKYIHSLGIYHRDLKPENILCFDGGLRIAIADFGLATTDKLSDEFRTGSVYYMSPECQGGEFAPTGNYSPMFNDIWSLGIILLKLATGRNPWKSATPNDPTFQTYLRDPFNFLPSVLPISPEVNDILIRMLEVDWRRRTTLGEVRYAIKGINNFYSDDVAFKGNIARRTRKAVMEIATLAPTPDTPSPSSDIPQEIIDTHAALHSRRRVSTSEVASTSHLLAEETSYGPQWTSDHTNSSDPGSSLPLLTNSSDTSFDSRLPINSRRPHQRGIGGMDLMTNTNALPHIYDCDPANDSVIAAYSTHPPLIEYDPYSFVNNPVAYSPDISVNALPDPAITAIGEDKEMTFPPSWTCSSEMPSPSLSHADPLPPLPVRDAADLLFRRSPSPEPLECQSLGFFPILHDTNVQSPSQTCQPIPSSSSSVTDFHSPLSSSRPFNTPFASRQEYALHHVANPRYPSQNSPSVGRSYNTDPSTRKRMTLDERGTGSGRTWTNHALRRSTEPIQTSRTSGTTWSGVSSDNYRGQTDTCPQFFVQPIEPQVKGLSSGIIVTMGLLPENPTEILFTADSTGLSSTSGSIWTHTFYSAMSFIGLDDSSDTTSEYCSLSSCEVSEDSSRGRLNFRIWSRGSSSPGVTDGESDRLSEALETPPDRLMTFRQHPDPMLCPPPISTPTSDPDGNLITKVASPVYNISFIRDVSSVCITGSNINFTTNIMPHDDHVRVGLLTLCSRSDPTAVYDSYERQMWIYQQTKRIGVWGPQLSFTSTSTCSGYLLSVPSLRTRDLEEVVKDVFTWLYSASSPHSIMWLHEGNEENSRTSLIGQCVANVLGKRRDLSASYFYTKRGPSPQAATTPFGTDKFRCIIPTIAYDLTRRIPEIRIPIALTAANNFWIFDLSLEEQMEKLIVDPLQTASKGHLHHIPRLFLIHGLEDCNDDNFQDLFLRAFGNSLILLQESLIPQKLLLLGRQTTHLETFFSKPEMEEIVLRRLLPRTN